MILWWQSPIGLGDPSMDLFILEARRLSLCQMSAWRTGDEDAVWKDESSEQQFCQQPHTYRVVSSPQFWAYVCCSQPLGPFSWQQHWAETVIMETGAPSDMCLWEPFKNKWKKRSSRVFLKKSLTGWQSNPGNPPPCELRCFSFQPA